ncbi:class I SAM-dependent methyltransferase [Kitasatospora sp. NPDC047058]|uniref:class I SAM-dependent methyltransferase n=1 Tax=Kitasatospora sp. NPDC047058 TaxID=3155620 RepID=UPI0033E58B2B
MLPASDPVAYGENVGDFYDMLYPAHEVPDVVAFVRGHVAEGARIVEFGTGTGRVAVPLAEHGYEVHGMDASPAMLDILKSKDPAGLVTVHTADFTRDVVGRDFDLCLLVNNTLFMMPSQDEQRTVLRRAAEHVAPGGLLVVECYEPTFFHALTGPHTQSSIISADKLLIDTIQCDPASQTVVYLRSLVSGGHVRTFPEVSRYSWPAEVDLMAKVEGFEPVERWADWRQAPFDRSAKRFISVYRRTGGPES